ncbi:MAG: hypothetical protein AABW87_01440 [Nanoarchaeota archaeon]
MKKGCVLWFFVFVLLLAPSVSSIGLSPSKMFVEYSQSREEIFSIYVMNNGDTAIDAHLYADGRYEDLIELPFEIIRLGIGEVREMKIKISFYKGVIEPGEQHVKIGVIAEPVGLGVSQTGIVPKTAVEMKVKFDVPYPGKYASLLLAIPDINAGEDLPVSLKLRNLGKETISNVKGEIFLEEDENLAGKIEFGMRNILPKTDAEYGTVVNTTGFKPGNYKGIAIVDYDSLKAASEVDFRIGSLFVNLTNHSKYFEKDSITPFDLHIQNRWNGKIDNVNADIIISREGNQVVSMKTPSINLNPWEASILRTYWDTHGLEKGEYDALVKINHLGSSSDYNLKVYIYEKIKIDITYILIGIIILIILVDILWLWRRRKSEEQQH